MGERHAEMSRRGLLAATGAAGLAGRAMAASDLKAAAREAWLYGLPMIEFARVRAVGALSAQNAPQKPQGFTHNRNLAGPEQRGVTTPNNDNLYSSAFIDLAGGPVTLTLPPSGERYLSVQLMDAYTNTFAVLGTRTTGGDGGSFTVVGPTEAAEPGVVRSPTPWAWLISRVLVDGPDDLDAARAVQSGVELSGPQSRKPEIYAQRDAPWGEYFAAVDALLRENPPPATDLAVLTRLAALGIGAGNRFDPGRFSAAEAAQIEAGVAEARAFLSAPRIPKAANGWALPPADLGDYGQDYVTRAAVALGGLGALTLDEAMYMRAVAPDGTFAFNDGRLYRLHFPAGSQPPTNESGFWSLTMYELTPEGQSYLTQNPIGRYAIGDRTPGLQYGEDGSLDIWIGRTDPGGEKSVNWLPAPAEGPYGMHMRVYLPGQGLRDGSYSLAAVTPA